MIKNIVKLIAPCIIGVCLTTACSKQKCNCSEVESYDPATEYLRELYVSYQGTLSDLVDKTQNYIDSVAPYSGLRALILVEACQEFNVPIVFVLAQGEIESHFGTKGLAIRTNSVWNVGAFDSLSYAGIKCKYQNPNDSVKPYLRLLTTNYLQNKTTEDLLESFVDLNGNRYASDKYYETRLKSKIQTITENSSIDDLQMKLNWYKLRLAI